jgi:hypothetical protein
LFIEGLYETVDIFSSSNILVSGIVQPLSLSNGSTIEVKFWAQGDDQNSQASIISYFNVSDYFINNIGSA